MGEIREAIIKGGKILCPYCHKVNGELTGKEEVHNFRIRCRGSGGRMEHFFMLNVNKKSEVKSDD